MINEHICFRVIAAFAFGLTLAHGAVLAGEPTTRPNIILCMADDQGWGDVGYNGHPVLKTPHLDAMADAGLRFDRFYAAAPVCSPTRGSVMTGRHPNRFGCFKWGHTLRPQEITLAEVLKKSGYVTGHFGKWHIGPVEKGSPVNPGASGFDEWLSAPNFFDNDPILSRQGLAIETRGESSTVTADAAIGFMRKHARSRRPFLAVVWFGSPHAPHIASKEDYAVYAACDEKKANFYGEIAGIDRAVGKLREEVRSLGIRDNTILWYCSDNGGLPGLGATGGRQHKGSIYEGGLRVPSIIEWPARIPRSRVTRMPASTVDVYPTLLELVSARPESQPPLDGVSLVPLIDGKVTVRSKAMGFWDYPAKGIRTPSKEWMSELLEVQRRGKEITDVSRLRLDAGEITTQYPRDRFPGHAAWLDWPWKLHRIEAQNGAVTMELYHLVNDPNEREDLLASQQERTRSMQVELERWLKSVVGSLNGDDY